MNNSEDMQNPYAAPRADVTEADIAVAQPEPAHVFSFNGRIGRFRFALYTLFSIVPFAMLLGLLLGLAAAFWHSPLSFSKLEYLCFAPFVYFARKRLHDIDLSAWCAVLTPLMIIPLFAIVIVLLLVLIPGTRDANSYGAPPPRHSPSLFFLGIPLTLAMLALVAFYIPQ